MDITAQDLDIQILAQLVPAVQITVVVVVAEPAVEELVGTQTV
jgi:hypothetical protein